MTQPAPVTPDPTPEGTAPAAQIEGDEPEVFDRAYVSQLRSESAERRTAAKAAEEKADSRSRQLFRAKVAATGKLADADDQPYDETLLDDDEALNAAIDATIAARPHYASRKPVPGSSIGQGQQGTPVPPKPSLIDAIKARQRR